ncbi:MAG: hypothetical protein QME64_07970 [bacterium]|nr:hypothetical protein [bacterium]
MNPDFICGNLRPNYFFVSKNIQVEKSFTVPSTASDHIPLVTVIRYTE